MARRYDKQIAPAPTATPKRRRPPTAAEIIRWMESELLVTEGELAGEPFRVRPFQKRFIRGFMKNTESALTMARSNGKTTLCAAIAAACIDGPLRVPRGQVIVIAKDKRQGSVLFNHLKHSLGNRLNDVDEWRVIDNDQHKFIEHRPTGALVRVYGSDPKSVHGLAPQIALLDEPAQWNEATAAKMYAAVATALGKQPHARLIALGTRPERGTGHWFSDMLDKAGAGIYVQAHWAPDDDDDKWPVFGMNSVREANPLYRYSQALRREIARARENARVQGGDKMASWNSYYLNRGTPDVVGRERIVDLDTWTKSVEMQEPPMPKGPVCVGVDLGGSTSMTAAALYWPECGLLRTVGAFPSVPSLSERGAKDGVGPRYERMHRRKEIVVYPGKVTPVTAFIWQLHQMLAGSTVIRVVADRFRKAEFEQALAEAGIGAVLCDGPKLDPHKAEKEADKVDDGRWPIVFRPVGGGPDGAMDVRAFQVEVYENHLKTCPSLMLRSAITESVVDHKDGNPYLDKARLRSRIDALQAAVLAVGAGRRWRKPDLDEGLAPFDVGRFAWGAA